MRKMNWFVGSVALGIGMIVGIVGYALATSPATADTLLVKLRGGKDNYVSSNNQGPAATNLLNPNGAADPADSPVGDNLNPDLSPITGQIGQEPLVPNQSGKTAGSNVAPQLAQQIIADYKQNIGTFFDAWKSQDMLTFRSKLSKAYTGELYEKHARRAENFIVQGIGLDVTRINFDQVSVESATTTSATLRADYRYGARDYSLGKQTPVGEEHEHAVHVRVNLVKVNSRWLITGETPLEE